MDVYVVDEDSCVLNKLDFFGGVCIEVGQLLPGDKLVAMVRQAGFG